MYVKKEIKRKTIFSIIIALIIFGFVVGNKAVAECPPNWTPVTMLRTINGCEYEITYCYRCGPTGADPTNIKVWRWAVRNSENCQREATWEEIWEKIREDWMQRCQIPPCSSGTLLNVILEYPMCKKTFNHAWYDQENGWQHFTWEEPCNVDLYYCQFIMTVCRRDDGTYFSECISAQTYGNSLSCLPQKPPLPPPGFTWYEDWESDCYVAESCQCP